ncbi:MAG: sulfatase-like hydrolase/transferase [Proteobacteria bacterium]|nr:sulfatase-like hydrolase/transferase [Pseudomonadota bacterium]
MTKPNIVVIITDGHRRDTVGAFGSQVCKTPNMDRLAAGGMCFDWAFTPTGLCSPARASFLSGTYAHEHGVMTNVVLHPLRRNLSPSADRLTPALREAGYRLGHVGKWHVNQQMTALDFGFDY